MFINSFEIVYIVLKISNHYKLTINEINHKFINYELGMFEKITLVFNSLVVVVVVHMVVPEINLDNKLAKKVVIIRW